MRKIMEWLKRPLHAIGVVLLALTLYIVASRHAYHNQSQDDIRATLHELKMERMDIVIHEYSNFGKTLPETAARKVKEIEYQIKKLEAKLED